MAHEPMDRHHKRRIAIVIVATQLVLAILTGTGVYAFYTKIDHNIGSDGATQHIVAAPPPAPKEPLNILFMGDDTRDCKGCHIDNQAGGGLSDTTILLHISADRKTAYGVSIPRDLLVRRPECSVTQSDGTVTHLPAEDNAQWNAAFALGGPTCTVRQTELLTGVHVDDYITIKFDGVKNIVNDVGGVQVCLSQPVNDQAYGIVLPAGTQTLDGAMALKFVRERHGIGDGSDIGRIKRQQSFLASLIKKVVSAGTLSNPIKLLHLALDASRSISTNPEIANPAKLVQLAEQIKGVDLSNIKFVTMPNGYYSTSSPYWGRVYALQPQTRRLWRLVRDDKPLTKHFTKTSINAKHPNGSKNHASDNQQYGLCS